MGGGGGEAGRVCGSVCGKGFFIFFSPYVKSARKLSSLFATVSSVSWGRGEGGRGDPQAWHPSLQLQVASYCLETWASV